MQNLIWLDFQVYVSERHAFKFQTKYTEQDALDR